MVSLNLKGNGIRDEGLHLISKVILKIIFLTCYKNALGKKISFIYIWKVLSENVTLEELDISLNEITPVGISYLAEVLPFSGIKNLNLSKNLLGDESLIIIADNAVG